MRGELVESGYVNADDEQIALTYADEGEPDQLLFAFTTSDLFTGDPVDGLELHADAPMIITFVVPSCSVCIGEAPKLAAAAEANPQVNFVMVHSFGTIDQFLAYTDNSDLSQENTVHIVDVDGALWERFGVVSQPSTVLVDHEGRVSSARGALGDDGLLRAVQTVGDL